MRRKNLFFSLYEKQGQSAYWLMPKQRVCESRCLDFALFSAGSLLGVERARAGCIRKAVDTDSSRERRIYFGRKWPQRGSRKSLVTLFSLPHPVPHWNRRLLTQNFFWHSEKSFSETQKKAKIKSLNTGQNPKRRAGLPRQKSKTNAGQRKRRLRGLERAKNAFLFQEVFRADFCRRWICVLLEWYPRLWDPGRKTRGRSMTQPDQCSPALFFWDFVSKWMC